MVYTLGESLLDIIISSNNNAVINPGGAMLNTAVSLGRSKMEVALITELGDDDTSELITSFLKSNNVSSKYIKIYADNTTSLALAFLDENKKPKYTFIKNYPHSRNINNIPKFNVDDILLFGSMYSIDEQIRKSILSIINTANKKDVTIIYDPNIRNAKHLANPKLMDALIENMKVSHIIKGSDEDFTNIFGCNEVQTQLTELRKINKSALILITLGADGVIADNAGHTIKLPAIKTNVISTIGAGDAYNAGIIFAMRKLNLKKNDFMNISRNQLEQILKSGLQFSSKVCATFDNYIPLNSL
jgi:fructokinase